MRQATRLLVAVTLLVGCFDPEVPETAGPDGGADEETVAAPLLVTPDNPLGNLTLVARPDGQSEINVDGASVWHGVGQGWGTGHDGMSAVVWSRAGDNLEIDVSADISAIGSVWLRVLVDGVVAQPSDVLFKNGGSGGVRSFRFVTSNVSAGA